MSRISSTLLSLALLSSVAPALAEGPMRGFTVGDNIDGESIQDLAGTGANAARFWCRAPVNVTSETEGEFYARIDECLSRFDDDLEYYEAHSIGAVIVLDPPAPIYVSGARVPQQNIFLSAAQQTVFKEGWRRIAAHYAAHPAVAAFDLLNEPATRKVAGGAAKWGAFAKTLVSTIRQAGAQQTIIVESEFGSPVKMSGVNKICKELAATGERNIAPSFHFYLPMTYTHQGLNGRAAGVPLDMKKLKKDMKLFGTAAKGAKNCGQPMYVGEVGASIYAPDREVYFNQVLGNAKSRGWSFSIHSWREGGDANSSVWNVEPTEDNPDSEPYEALMDLLE